MAGEEIEEDTVEEVEGGDDEAINTGSAVASVGGVGGDSSGGCDAETPPLGALGVKEDGGTMIGVIATLGVIDEATTGAAIITLVVTLATLVEKTELVNAAASSLSERYHLSAVMFTYPEIGSGS
jgi:hypothetical protein